MRSSTATLAAWMAWRNRSVSCKPRLCKSLVIQGPSLQQIHNDLHHLTMAVWFKLPCRTLKQAFMGGKNLAGTGITHTLQAALRKICIGEGDCGRVGIRVAGDLAQYPVTFA